MESEDVVIENEPKSYEELAKKFVNWAETCSHIRGAMIVGSRARVDRPADEWADLDIVVITTDPEHYLATTDWIKNIGNPLLTFVEPTATGGEMERRVLFGGMLDVDFSIISKRNVQQILQHGISSQIASQISNIFGRGVHVLLDKDGMIGQFRALVSSIATPAPRPPTQNEFLSVINDFLYHAVWTTKKLRRSELWTAKLCVDVYMKRLLLRMMEWHSHATKGWDYDTWFRGRFLEEWADRRALERLRNAFAHYDEEDVKRALLATMDTFRWITKETAQKLSYPYPTEVDDLVTEWVRISLLTKTHSNRKEK